MTIVECFTYCFCALVIAWGIRGRKRITIRHSFSEIPPIKLIACEDENEKADL